MILVTNVTKFLLVLTFCTVWSLVTARSFDSDWNITIYKYTVHIVNGFTGTNETLEAHCKSKDDDLGVRHVAVHNVFNWSFHIAPIFATTKFSCHMWWSGGEKYLDVFRVDGKFLDECGENNCFWMSRNDGIYFFFFNSKEYFLVYYWEPWHGKHTEKKMS
ncbi:hypothetical protein V6N13_046093 [Hibiscus sabdariffa]|uniref:S-protein homolog n=1 Tax=Hibiscus sabdariffa TaxID=183260 RepID=A0ABR2B4J1_9ROSI